LIHEPQEHIPVMVQEVVEALKPGPGKIFLDGTVGYGGHAKAILVAAGKGARLIGLDRDGQALTAAKEELVKFDAQIMLKHKNFQFFDEVLEETGIAAVDGMLLDLGLSSAQLTYAERGFSFQEDGPLDMRMDLELPLTAADIVNRYPADELANLIYEFGEERHSRRYARAIIKARQNQKIARTGELAQIILRATPGAGRRRIHPATRVFQALRIAVNNELEELDHFLDKFINHLNPQGRVAILSYHSLEDRRVKRAFRAAHQQGDLNILTKKPQTPSEDEIFKNPRARSAKLRIAERTSHQVNVKGNLL
jgi:16S rRNA (cytosine1402-N4)-methyltransferase